MDWDLVGKNLIVIGLGMMSISVVLIWINHETIKYEKRIQTRNKVLTQLETDMVANPCTCCNPDNH